MSPLPYADLVGRAQDSRYEPPADAPAPRPAAPAAEPAVLTPGGARGELSGRSLDGWQVGDLIGAGAAGAVYRALQPGTGRAVALKVLTGAAGWQGSFAAEARAAALVDSPQVVRLLHAGDGLPPWLRDAVEVFADPLHLAGGAPRLAHLAGRSLAHVNRTIHAAQGRTATALVNALRLEWAAARLRLGGEPVAAIAAACGLANLSHFYALFRARYGATPHRYRADAGRLTQNEVEEIAKTPSRQGSRR
ncbi:MAG: helix-turn-helix domain-containing protein [Planctomycetes bacterium]|nr:helix-turn-helix domain-containing protein [Planctomycetota bacterium]